MYSAPFCQNSLINLGFGMRYKLLIVLLVLSLPVWADDERRDSVKIKEVEIAVPRLLHFSVTEKVQQVDSLTIARYASQDLGALLQKISLVNISSNGGAGGLTTAGIRGASSNQTAVLWNGLPVNSLTTGSADLSLINVGGFNDITITYGAVGTLYGSGTMGGAIELLTKPDWNKGMHFNVKGGIGSFSNYSTYLNASYSDASLAYSARVYYQDSKNDFEYKDIYDHGRPIEKQTHNETSLIGTIHNLYYRTGVGVWDAGLWYQEKEKNIPGLMGVGPPLSNQTQKDSIFKVYAGWKGLLNTVRLEGKVAYLSDFLRYADNIVSEIESKRWLTDASARWYYSTNLTLDLNARYSRLEGITSNYAENITEHEGRVNVAVKYSSESLTVIGTVGKDWNGTEVGEYNTVELIDGVPVNVTKAINEVPDPPLQLSLSGKYMVVPERLSLRGKVATHYRRPTFNDRYWDPGGNIDLLPEEGMLIELGMGWSKSGLAIGDLFAEIDFYRADNKESIAWKPAGAIWRPVNTGEIEIQGMDLELKNSIDVGNDRMINRLMYAYNNAFDNAPESERYKETLAYRPKHTLKVGTDYISEKWNGGVLVYGRSKSNTWEGYKVDGNCLIDINAAYNLSFRKADIELGARVENVLNTSYQLVRFYPMPGRAYFATINIKL